MGDRSWVWLGKCVVRRLPQVSMAYVIVRNASVERHGLECSSMFSYSAAKRAMRALFVQLRGQLFSPGSVAGLLDVSGTRGLPFGLVGGSFPFEFPFSLYKSIAPSPSGSTRYCSGLPSSGISQNCRKCSFSWSGSWIACSAMAHLNPPSSEQTGTYLNHLSTEIQSSLVLHHPRLHPWSPHLTGHRPPEYLAALAPFPVQVWPLSRDPSALLPPGPPGSPSGAGCGLDAASLEQDQVGGAVAAGHAGPVAGPDLVPVVAGLGAAGAARVVDGAVFTLSS